jgi:signal transduction histidine kinase
MERAHRAALVLSRLVAALTEQLRAEQTASATDADDVRDDAPVDVAAVVRECVELAEPIATDKHIDLAASLEPVTALGPDRPAVHSVVANLLSNAIDYTPAGGRVRVRAERSGQLCRITVEDSGIGIAEADRERIFDPFFRVDGARSPSARATAAAHLGLGLWIVRTHLRRSDGACEVRSDPGRGARFIVTWPAGPTLPRDANVSPKLEMVTGGNG